MLRSEPEMLNAAASDAFRRSRCAATFASGKPEFTANVSGSLMYSANVASLLIVAVDTVVPLIDCVSMPSFHRMVCMNQSYAVEVERFNERGEDESNVRSGMEDERLAEDTEPEEVTDGQEKDKKRRGEIKIQCLAAVAQLFVV